MMSWIEVGIGPVSWTLMSFIQLTDGTLVDDCFSIAQGIDGILDLSGYISMAAWVPISK
jgi:hypothetical protein